MTDLFLWRGLLFGEAAESIFPAKSFYEIRCSGENETSAEKDTLRGRKIVLGVLPIPSSDSALRLYVLQQQLYSNLLSNTAWQNSSSILQGFVSSNANNNFGLFHTADSLLSVNDTNTVNTIVGNIAINNTVDDHYAAYYNWMLNIKKGTGVLPQDTSAIFSLATGCPSVDGSVVFAARNLYNSITHRIYHFADGCKINNNPASKKIVKGITKITNYQKEIKVYPNPINGEVNIQLPNAGNWQIFATDIAGRAIWQQVCNGCEGVIKHVFEGAKGIYFIKITNTDTGQQSINKITLQ